MAIAITDEHRELETVAQSFLRSAKALQETRAALDQPAESIPQFWKALADLGWLGVHVSEERGGGGGGMAELVVIVEAMGHVPAPGPFLPTAATSAIVDRVATADQAATLLPGLIDGTTVAGLGLNGSVELAENTVSGDAGVVLCAATADLLTVVSGDDVYLIPAGAPGVQISDDPNLDPSRRAARVRLDDVPRSQVTVLTGSGTMSTNIARILFAAEAVGGARRCVEMAVDYAKVRHQFGRPIGAFGPVKHHCANMFANAELAAAAVWDAARATADSPDQLAIAAASAAAIAVPRFQRNAQLNVQVHGGIGFTWEHDAHIFVRRAAALAALACPAACAENLTTYAVSGWSREVKLELPDDAERYRREISQVVDGIAAAPKSEQRAQLVDSGLAMPHWPRPWGREATPVEQLVIDEELQRAKVHKVHLGITGWILMALIQHGTPEQVSRWVRPALEGDVSWCQLFSEPEAGSDAAAIRTRGRRVDGGWLVSGQKVWTSAARQAAFGLATVRTDPAAAKHSGITAMVIDMNSPGVEIRPLRDAAGTSLFNEVFFEEVFVDDADVVGTVDGGWQVARSTLGNERVTIGGDGLVAGFDPLRAWQSRRIDIDGGRTRIGELLAEQHGIRSMNLRRAARAVAGGEPGPEGNVTKLLSAEHGQHVLDAALDLLGPDAMLSTDTSMEIGTLYMYARQNTISGGTSEISRNQIGERILGLPRDPLLS